MAKYKYTESEKIWMKNHPDFNEKWLQSVIAENPAILGLGDLALIEKERMQEHAGRLDLLFEDPQGESRYEVEVMLGAMDESHIIRCIEYWDIERRRYPGFDHYAVLIAESITSRFLNVLNLFVGTIPLIVIQINALTLEDRIILDFVKVIDKTELRKDDTNKAKLIQTDRKYWEERTNSSVLDIVDKILSWVNDNTEIKMVLNYNKFYISVSKDGDFFNFMYIRPRKNFIHFHVLVDDLQGWLDKLDNEKIDASAQKRGSTNLQLTIPTSQFKKASEMLEKLIADSVKGLR